MDEDEEQMMARPSSSGISQSSWASAIQLRRPGAKRKTKKTRTPKRRTGGKKGKGKGKGKGRVRKGAKRKTGLKQALSPFMIYMREFRSIHKVNLRKE